MSVSIDPKTAEWLSKTYKIPVEDIVWYNGGICYSRVIVKTKESADKVTAVEKNNTVNGGWFHGMPLGGQTETQLEDGTTAYDVMC